MKTVQIKDIKSVIIDKKLQNEQITVKCWIRTNRDSGKIGFIEGYDGSTLDGIQIVYKKEVTKNFEEAKKHLKHCLECADNYFPARKLLKEIE